MTEEQQAKAKALTDYVESLGPDADEAAIAHVQTLANEYCKSLGISGDELDEIDREVRAAMNGERDEMVRTALLALLADEKNPQ